MYRCPLSFTIDLVSDGSTSFDVDLSRVLIGWDPPFNSDDKAFIPFPKMLFPDSVVDFGAGGFTVAAMTVTNGVLHVAVSGTAPSSGSSCGIFGKFLYNAIP